LKRVILSDMTLYSSDMVMFWGFSNSTGESILNSLEAVYLGDVYVQEERITVA